MTLAESILANAVAASAPLILAAMAGILSERAGVANIALEGKMLLGAFVAIPVAAAWGVPAGVAAALLAGLALGLLHAAATQTLRVGPIVSGVAINILAAGLTSYLARLGTLALSANGPGAWPVPGLAGLPAVGPILFQQSPFTYAAWLVAAGTACFLWRTPWGLWVTAAGENPAALWAAGVNVTRLRYVAVGMAGILAAAGGAQLSLGLVQNFTVNMTAGRGFIALAAVVFGRWRPGGAFVACVFFALTDAVASGLQLAPAIAAHLPTEFLNTLPYVATLLALLVFSRRSHAPAAMNEMPA